MPEQLIGQPQVPTFPQININVIPNQGMAISVILAPGLSLNQVLGIDIMRDIVRKHLETDEALLNEIVQQTLAMKKSQLALIHHIKESKIN